MNDWDYFLYAVGSGAVKLTGHLIIALLFATPLYIWVAKKRDWQFYEVFIICFYLRLLIK